jgi:hypothetical protein
MTAEYPQGDEPLIPMPALSLPALRQAVATVAWRRPGWRSSSRKSRTPSPRLATRRASSPSATSTSAGALPSPRSGRPGRRPPRPPQDLSCSCAGNAPLVISLSPLGRDFDRDLPGRLLHHRHRRVLPSRRHSVVPPVPPVPPVSPVSPVSPVQLRAASRHASSDEAPWHAKTRSAVALCDRMGCSA